MCGFQETICICRQMSTQSVTQAGNSESNYVSSIIISSLLTSLSVYYHFRMYKQSKSHSSHLYTIYSVPIIYNTFVRSLIFLFTISIHFNACRCICLVFILDRLGFSFRVGSDPIQLGFCRWVFLPSLGQVALSEVLLRKENQRQSCRQSSSDTYLGSF